MSSIDQDYGQFRRTRVKGVLSQGVPLLDETAGETEYRLNTTTHGSGSTIPGGFPLDNISHISTPYDSILHEEFYSRTEGAFPNSEDLSKYPISAPYAAPKSTASNSNTLTRTPIPATGSCAEYGKHGTPTSSKRGREPTGKGSSQQGSSQKRPRRNRAVSAVRSNNGRDAGGGGEEDEEDEDEEDEDEEDEESDEDDGHLVNSGPKEPHALPCPMPSCEGKGKLWDNWNNLIQHLQNTHIKGFSICERGCGQRFGLSSQYTRHVFKRKKECKPSPLSGPPRRIPPLALDFNHAVGKVKGQNYTKLKQVIADHQFYDLEDPDHSAHHLEPPSLSTSSRNAHQYNPQGQQAAGGIDQIIRLLREHQRICQMHPQTDPPFSGPVRTGGRPSGSSGFIENQQTSQNPIDPTIPPSLNQPAIHRPDVYGAQASATAAYLPGSQNGPNPSLFGNYRPSNHFTPQLGQVAQDGGFSRSSAGNYYHQNLMTNPYSTPTGGYIDNNIRANRAAPPSELDHNSLAPTPGYSLNSGATYGSGAGDATRFNRGS
ncbi:hypothetical protein C7212DRAFT_172808 [Tuber magnatum]|uniref:Uncharacterized protein n=1 Tax=Tuber magnatum TaxID=42249 RepID=A0A317T135_9PEZI|nr:hypothetical protein C7212DRAFT_172808 [Tuber magnatum]